MKKPFLILFVAVNAALSAGFVFAEGTMVRTVLAALVFLINSLNYAWIHASCSAVFKEVAGLGDAIAANRFDAALSGSPLLDSEGLGKSLGALEEGLKKRLSMDEAMLANIIVPMALVDQKGNITWMNESMVALTENTGTPASYLGRHFSEFFYGDSRETLAEKALREQSRQMAKTEFDTRKGNHKFISVAATPIKDFDGRVMGGFVTVADFTNIVLKERQITDQNARIARAVTEACEVAQRVAEAATEMERRIGQTSLGMQNQRNRTDEVAAAIEEMNATILEVARNAGDAAGTAAKASETTRKGTELVQKVTSVMDALSAKAAGLKTEMEDLGRQAQGIGQIMQVISDIADQTNLLALNAAIEAARAGDAGRGFAVVADEVRKLAEKTMTATREVGGYITAIQDSTKRNMLATDDTTRGIGEAEGAAGVAGEALRQIMDYVERTTDQVRGIATAAEQQSSTSEEINRSTHDIHQIAGETAEAMTQAAGAVAQLSGLAADLNAAMEHMRQE